MDICAKWAFIILSVIMPVSRSSIRSTAKMGLEYDFGIFEFFKINFISFGRRLI